MNVLFQELILAFSPIINSYPSNVLLPTQRFARCRSNLRSHEEKKKGITNSELEFETRKLKF